MVFSCVLGGWFCTGKYGVGMSTDVCRPIPIKIVVMRIIDKVFCLVVVSVTLTFCQGPRVIDGQDQRVRRKQSTAGHIFLQNLEPPPPPLFFFFFAKVIGPIFLWNVHHIAKWVDLLLVWVFSQQYILFSCQILLGNGFVESSLWHKSWC